MAVGTDQDPTEPLPLPLPLPPPPAVSSSSSSLSSASRHDVSRTNHQQEQVESHGSSAVATAPPEPYPLSTHALTAITPATSLPGRMLSPTTGTASSTSVHVHKVGVNKFASSRLLASAAGGGGAGAIFVKLPPPRTAVTMLLAATPSLHETAVNDDGGHDNGDDDDDDLSGTPNGDDLTTTRRDGGEKTSTSSSSSSAAVIAATISSTSDQQNSLPSSASSLSSSAPPTPPSSSSSSSSVHVNEGMEMGTVSAGGVVGVSGVVRTVSDVCNTTRPTNTNDNVTKGSGRRVITIPNAIRTVNGRTTLTASRSATRWVPSSIEDNGRENNRDDVMVLVQVQGSELDDDNSHMVSQDDHQKNNHHHPDDHQADQGNQGNQQSDGDHQLALVARAKRSAFESIVTAQCGDRGCQSLDGVLAPDFRGDGGVFGESGDRMEIN